MSERAGNFAVDLMCRVAGRRNVIRAAQFTLSRARPDYRENMRINSRIALQAWVLDIMPRGWPVHVVDAGANVGDWSRAFLALAESRGRLADVDLHALEPSTEPFRQLTKTLGNSAASVHQLALSDHLGEMTLHITRENSS